MKYIAICGTVGSGKTTLLRRLTQRLGDRAAWHEERPQDNPFITDYYADTKRWTFHAQVSFLSLYFDRPKWREETAELFFFDRCFLENLVIAQYRRDQGDLTEDEYQTLCQLANGVSALMPRIDKYIYLDCSINTILEHIRGRGRDYEDEHVRLRAEGTLRRVGQDAPAGADADRPHGRRRIRS